MRTVANALVELSKEARTIFLQEPRLLKIKAPTYVLGEFLNTLLLSCAIYGGDRKLRYLLVCNEGGTESYYLLKTHSEMYVSFCIFKLNTS